MCSFHGHKADLCCFEVHQVEEPVVRLTDFYRMIKWLEPAIELVNKCMQNPTSNNSMAAV